MVGIVNRPSLSELDRAVRIMKTFFRYRWLLILLLVSTCFLLTDGRGRGGGGRGGGSRGSSSRGSSSRGSSSSSSRGTSIERNRNRDRSQPAPQSKPAYKPSPRPATSRPKPAPSPRPPAPSPRPYVPSPKPSAPEIKPQEPNIARQPAYNPNFKETDNVRGAPQPPYNPNYNPNSRGQNPPGNQQPPPYPPGGAPPPYSHGAPPPPYAPGGPPPPYTPGRQPPPYAPGGPPPPYAPGGPPPPYSPSIGQPGVGQPYPPQPGMRPAPYPQQPGAHYPQQPGAHYPQQPGAHYPQQPGAYYPQQPGMRAPYPQQPGYRPPYPIQQGRPYPQQPLGGNTWQPQSGRPAPSYMNYGGLPAGGNINVKPHKKQGFLGSLMSMGGSKHKTGKKNKYYGSQPSPYAVGGMAGAGAMGGFMGKRGTSAAMYTILPFMAARHGSSLFKPRFGFMPIFMPSPFYHHHYHGYYHPHMHRYYDVYDNEYVGKCNRPIKGEHSNITCNSTRSEVDCEAQCEEGYRFPDNTTTKENKCWHVSGVWRPTKNFPECKPTCNETCLNNGTCIRPGVCGCPAEYRGPHCEFHFLNCDIRKLAGDTKIRWVCTHTKDQSVCRIKCAPPGEFETPPANEYKCDPQGKWTPDFVPKCVVKAEDEKKGELENL